MWKQGHRLDAFFTSDIFSIMAFFFVRNTLGVLFCQSMLWSCGKITAAKATTTVTAVQSETFSTITESTPTAMTKSTVLLTSTNSTSLTTTIQSPSYSTRTLSTSLPTSALSFLTSTPKASSLPTTTESKPLPTTAKSTSLTTTIQRSSLPTAIDSTSLPTIIKSKTLPETTHSMFLPTTTRPKPFPTTIESSSNRITAKSPSLTTTAESTALPMYITVFLSKATKPTSLPTTTQGPPLSTSLPKEHKTSETTKGENENKGSGQSSQENSFIVYGIVLCCVAVFLVALLFIVRRKDNFIMKCIKRNRNEARGGDTEGRGQEMSHYASVGDLILSFPDDDSPEDKNLPGQSAAETHDSPVYDVLEGPYLPPMEGGFQSNEQSKTVHDYASKNDGCVMDEEISYPIPSGNFEVSFLEEIYTTLNADRGNEEGNLYESLRDHKTSNERSDSWSIRGMQSMDQDYVSIVSD